MNDLDVGSRMTADTADDVLGITLRDVLERGEKTRQEAGQSVGTGQETKELLHYPVVLNSPRHRLIFNDKRHLNLFTAVSRFVWMMAANNRLADISFYEDKVLGFTDDGIIVPGSSYGHRMLNPRPGLNQLESVIKELRVVPSSRRAAISIFQPEDAVRDSRDIPCTFGIFYHIRNGNLLSTTLMRSNNAFGLLHYNIFEFSLLAEIVAAELGVTLGPMTHHAVSMHVYERDYQRAGEVVTEWQVSNPGQKSVPMPQMPSKPRPLEQIKQLVLLEAKLRHGSAGLRGTNIENWVAEGADLLHPYWRQLYFLLLLYVAKKNNDASALSALDTLCEEPWHSLLGDAFFRNDTPKGLGGEFLSPSKLDREGGRVEVVPLFSGRAVQSLKGRVDEWEQKKEQTLSWKEYARLQETLLERLAARGGKGFDGEISVEDFERALRAVKDNVS